ncbi:hypothetical protein [Ulvibacterium marinum]|uniref:Uncharacterized protein n=1 Tax=Ulvibacterium marinum TaxID=2419782 RepID=A0A3B0CAP4_9FLAO|nr:hypothetical protein [Ulvibacterium marinum]RKN81039.1 hypothetical protein D7Z94_08800 [Ulvibacterium marinum]
MSIFWKIIAIVLVWILVLAWNKYVIQEMVEKVVRMNPKNSWLASKKEIIKKAFQVFFLIFCVLFTASMVISK